MPRSAAGSDPPAAAASTSETRPGAKDSRPPPLQIGAYRVDGELGRGGMARVYRVVDESTGRRVALKQLDVREDLKSPAAALIEREFHTLAQLSHPSVIEVYDYGIAERGPYYTMELLDGGDLRTRSPMPWREVCEVAFDVCSSLALLHSRRLVHRDITPRNVRCTQAGRAKLIDFGAMVPMGPGGHVIGTPAFIAPEVVHRSFVDGRADLFSLGATMYYALTRRAPYPARELSQVHAVWRATPASPSTLVADIPAELDLLVMSMLSVEPALRPRGAHEVMERLHVIARLGRDEALDVSQAYLATPVMVGRQEPLATFRRAMERASSWRGSGLMVHAGAGLGRSRLLDAFALEAKLLGASILRASADSKQTGNLALARALVEQLSELHPESAKACARELDPKGTMFVARAAADDAEDGQAAEQPPLSLGSYPEGPGAQLALQTVLAQWFLRISLQHALLIAVDDVDRIDEPSTALLAALAHHARRNRLLLAVTCERVAAEGAGALDVLAQQCTGIPLRPLDQAETETLLGSVFGDVPNIALLAVRVHAVALGRPRDCMAIARHLVERGVIKYAAGNWTLPEQLETADLPLQAQDVCRARIAALRPLARRLAGLHAHALVDTFTRDEYVQLNPATAAGDVDGAINELLSQELLHSDGRTYALAQRELRALLKEELSESAGMELHRMLAELAEQSGKRIEAVSHLLSAGLHDRAIDSLFETFIMAAEPQGLEKLSLLPFHEIALVLERALDAIEVMPRKARDVWELRRWVFLSSVAADDQLHARTGPAFLAQLEHDTGLALWRELGDVSDPMQRLMQALTRAGERYAATPEAERVYRVDEALTSLVYYVVISIAVGARTFNGPLIDSLPPLLEPFAPLSPAIHAMWQNAMATSDLTAGRPERGYERWLALYEQLEHMDDKVLTRIDLIRNAIAYALGSIDAQIGRDSVGRWTAILDQDPLQQVNAMYLRRVLCLHRGDLQSAERFRRKAEVLAVQATTRQMFSTASVVELSIAAMTRDLTGVKHTYDKIVPLAAKHPGWQPFLELAQMHFHRLRGDLVSACAAAERGLALVAPQGEVLVSAAVAWCQITNAYVDVLIEMERCEEARAMGERALATCAERGIGQLALEIGRTLAIAQAKLGDLAGAAARLDAIIAAQQAYGGHGLILGASYEARTRVAIWAGDHAAVEHYGQLAAHEYRHGRTTPLGARYERLIQEARVAGMNVLPQLDSFTSTHVGPTALGGVRATIESQVTGALSRAEDPQARARIALEMLCEAHAATGGHLYLLRDDGIELAASSNAKPPDAELDRFVSSFWQRHAIDADVPTAFIPETGAAPPSTTVAWTDERGLAYQPILIGTVVSGDTLHVGVAALVLGEHPHRDPNAMQVTASVGSYLAGAGDVIAFKA